MGMVWEDYYKGVPLLGVPGITLDCWRILLYPRKLTAGTWKYPGPLEKRNIYKPDSMLVFWGVKGTHKKHVVFGGGRWEIVTSDRKGNWTNMTMYLLILKWWVSIAVLVYLRSVYPTHVYPTHAVIICITENLQLLPRTPDAATLTNQDFSQFM